MFRLVKFWGLIFGETATSLIDAVEGHFESMVEMLDKAISLSTLRIEHDEIVIEEAEERIRHNNEKINRAALLKKSLNGLMGR